MRKRAIAVKKENQGMTELNIIVQGAGNCK